MTRAKNRVVRIVNPIPGRSAFTHRRAAEHFVQRGRAVWTDSSKTAIRFLEAAEVVLERQLRVEMARDEAYWRSVAIQRGGDEVFFEWKPSLSNGYVVMGATLVAIPNRAQLAHGATEGRRC